jgi:predicted porin
MKKTLVAIAALTAVSAFAQSSVTITGTFDAGYQSLDYKGVKVNGIAHNGSATTGFAFNITEDMGGGLKAVAKLGTDFSPTSQLANSGVKNADGTLANGSTFGNGELFVGLTGKFGQLHLGSPNNASFGSFSTGQPFGTAIGSSFRGLYATDDSLGTSLVRQENSVKYQTPAISGFTGVIYKSQKQTKAVVGNYSSTFGNYDFKGTQEIGLNYANGPLNASYTTQTQDSKDVATSTVAAYATGTTATTWTNTAGTTDNKLNTFGANYTIGATTAYFLNQTNKKSDGTNDRSATSFSVKHVMGVHTIMATVGDLKAKSGTNNGKNSKVVGLGYDYALSKTSSLYARYESIKDDAVVLTQPTQLTAVTGNNDRTRTAIGLRVGF